MRFVSSCLAVDMWLAFSIRSVGNHLDFQKAKSIRYKSVVGPQTRLPEALYGHGAISDYSIKLRKTFPEDQQIVYTCKCNVSR